jgi:hypothetical protein
MKQIEYNPEVMHWRRRTQTGQSAIVALIVLFLLLFIAAIFISIVAGNLKNTRVAANVTAAGRFAQAGINYLDQQLTNSPQGADWRPVPDCQVNQPCTNISQTDPDYFWLQPYNSSTGVGGYTRVNFGSEVAGTPLSASQSGGRALVRLTYQPGAIDPHTGKVDPLSRYIRLEAVGRVGQINPNDPTTYSNTEGLSQRVELLAYKAIGLNEYVRNITNKDNKDVTVTLGTNLAIRDRGLVEQLESVYEGAIYVNAPLTFYGVNRIILDPTRGDALNVSGSIQLNNVQDSITLPNFETLVTNNTLPTSVYIDVAGLSANPQTIVPAGQPANTPAVLPSNSANFTTLGPELSNLSGGTINGYALVRDNPLGNETANLPTSVDAFNNTYQNLRSTPRQAPPVIDNTIGQNGLTRYRALTRDSAPLRPTDVSDNAITIGTDLAGLYGWGQGLYINNPNDNQTPSQALLINTTGYTQRGDWLNPLEFNKWWNKGDQRYSPPAVTITLYPRYFVIDSNTSQGTQNYLRLNNGTQVAGQIVRYTELPNFGKPTGVGSSANANYNLAGYPATVDPVNGYYSGDFVIYAEGNVRIRGVVGGLDAQTQTYFKRHVTVVSNATIYVEGNLLRDNILGSDTNPTAAQVRGQSTIALLAKDYIAVNTTQFFVAQVTTNTPGSSNSYSNETGNQNQPPFALTLNHPDTLMMTSGFGPIFAANGGFTIPAYLTGVANSQPPTLLVRHAVQDTGAPQDDNGNGVNLNIFMSFNGFTNFYDFNGGVSANAIPYSMNTSDGYTDRAFTLPAGALYPLSGGNGTLGFTNVINVTLDNSTSTDYRQTRAATVPSDIRIEAMMYAQEGSFFIIPGPWFNPDANDSYDQFVNGPVNRQGHRFNDEPGNLRVDPRFPFYGEPLDVRITFCGTINENLPADVGDQGAWMEKWGWVPTNYGSTGLQYAQNYLPPNYTNNTLPTMHGPNSPFPELQSGTPNKVAANGIVYQFDDRTIYPYAPAFSTESGNPLRPNPYNPSQPLPFAPCLPVAPGLLYYGQNPVR